MKAREELFGGGKGGPAGGSRECGGRQWEHKGANRV